VLAADKVEDIESWILQVYNNLSFKLLICSSSTSSKASKDLSDTDIESWASIGKADFADGESEVNSDDAKAINAYALDTASVSVGNAEAKLYNSGALQHISPFWHHFITYQSINP
jgi:hypothetical protein